MISYALGQNSDQVHSETLSAFICPTCTSANSC